MSAPAQPIPADVLISELGIESPADIDIEAIAQYCGAAITYAPLAGSEARLIGFDRSEECYIQEDSIRTTTGLVISLLWWKNERKILDTMKREDRGR